MCVFGFHTLVGLFLWMFVLFCFCCVCLHLTLWCSVLFFVVGVLASLHAVAGLGSFAFVLGNS